MRGLANYELVKETPEHPNVRIGFGLQGISTGNPGYFITSEKTHYSEALSASAYVGFGIRTNEDHGHALGGFKVTPKNGDWTLGVQMDGHAFNPFVTYRVTKGVTVGYYWIDTKTGGLMVSFAK